MNLKLSIICIAAVLVLVVPAAADNSTAKVYGGVYSSDTFEPLDNAIVDINSTPSQSMVAKSGIYSFELDPGNYSITAKYYQNSTLAYIATETVTITKVGSYRLDLLLLPVYSDELMEVSTVNLSSYNSTSDVVIPGTLVAVNKTDSSNSVNVPEKTRIGIPSSAGSYILIALALFFILAVRYGFSKKHQKINKNEPLNEKIDHITGDSAKNGNLSEFTSNTQDKIIEPEISQSSNISIEEAAPIKPIKSEITVTGQVVEFDSRVSEIAESELEEKNISSKESADDPEIEISASKKNQPLPADLQEIMDIIRGHGGRITQKDLRSRLKYSEGKVSLMLADLERRELIEKFKRGRGNVVILRDEEQ